VERAEVLIGGNHAEVASGGRPPLSRKHGAIVPICWEGNKMEVLRVCYIRRRKVTQFRRGRDCAQARYENEH